MRVLLIRHAKAVDRSPSDAARTLTDEGRGQMQRIATELRQRLASIDIIACSPLVRTRQTADIIAAVFGVRPVREQRLLAPGASPPAVLEWLDTCPPRSTVAVVGHQPDMGELIRFFVAGAPRVNFQPGTTILVAFDDALLAGEGELVWTLNPDASGN